MSHDMPGRPCMYCHSDLCSDDCRLPGGSLYHGHAEHCPAFTDDDCPEDECTCEGTADEDDEPRDIPEVGLGFEEDW